MTDSRSRTPGSAIEALLIERIGRPEPSSTHWEDP